MYVCIQFIKTYAFWLITHLKSDITFFFTTKEWEKSIMDNYLKKLTVCQDERIILT